MYIYIYIHIYIHIYIYIYIHTSRFQTCIGDKDAAIQSLELQISLSAQGTYILKREGGEGERDKDGERERHACSVWVCASA